MTWNGTRRSITSDDITPGAATPRGVGYRPRVDIQAAVLRETKGSLSVETIDIGGAGPGEVRVRIAASGLCHTDWETMHGFQPCNLPPCSGHEGAGIVDSIGPRVRLVKVGDRVALSWSPNCGHCFYCDLGQPILCEVAAAANAKGVLFDGRTRFGSRRSAGLLTTASCRRMPR